MTDDEAGAEGTDSDDDGSAALPTDEEPTPELAGEFEGGHRPDDGHTPELTGEIGGGRSGPLGDLAGRVDERRGSEPDAEFDDLFEDTGDARVDTDALWEQVDGEGSFAAETAEDEPDRRVVEKRQYCQGCEYFSDPPDVACTHQGTEILEVVDVAHFEVFNCPVVRENEELERL